MKILILGSGGREHALAHTFVRQGHSVFCLPGNAGTDEISLPVNASWKRITFKSREKIVRFVKENGVDLTVVGPEGFLAEGIVDYFQKDGLKIFGPTKDAALLESSKIFAKKFMAKYKIPTPQFTVCSEAKEAFEWLNNHFDDLGSVVIKPDGLTAGKGVTICDSIEEAKEAVNDIMVIKKYGVAGEKIVIEEKLEGEEVSVLAFSDGDIMVAMPPSQDHKKLLDGDRGPNTGGVGAYCPLYFIDKPMEQKIEDEIIDKTRSGLHDENIRYRGVLYFGLILTKEGPKVLEYNCRFGDPETQAVLPLLESDLADIMNSCLEGNLSKKISWRHLFACNVVLISSGYPGNFEVGKRIFGLRDIAEMDNVFCFHAGTKKDAAGNIVTAGGRVLSITGVGSDLSGAVNLAYSAIKRISFEGACYRKDIALKAKY